MAIGVAIGVVASFAGGVAGSVAGYLASVVLGPALNSVVGFYALVLFFEVALGFAGGVIGSFTPQASRRAERDMVPIPAAIAFKKSRLDRLDIHHLSSINRISNNL